LQIDWIVNERWNEGRGKDAIMVFIAICKTEGGGKREVGRSLVSIQGRFSRIRGEKGRAA
jgi:hypothetical protein